MKMFKRGKVWYVDYVDANGHRQRPSTGQTDERLAKARAAEIVHAALVDQLNSTERKTLGTNLTLGAILTRTYTERWSKQRGATERKYQLALLIEDVGHWSINQTTPVRLKDYANSLLKPVEEGGKGLKPATVNRKLSMLKTAMGEACDLGEIPGVPRFPFFTEDNEKERYVTPEEEQQILAWFDANVAPADNITRYFRDLFVLLIDTGLRTSEGLGLTPERLVENGTAIRLPKGTRAASKLDRTKSGKSRTVPLTKRAQEAAIALMANEIHRKYDGNWGSLRFGRLMDRIGIPDIGLHTLRHTCASRLAQSGKPAQVIQEWLGHANPATTARYMHLAPSNLRDAADALENFGQATPEAAPAATAPAAPAGTITLTPEQLQAIIANAVQAAVSSHPISFPLPTTHDDGVGTPAKAGAKSIQ